MKSARSAVKLVRSLIGRQLVGHTVEREAPARNAVGEASDDGAEVTGVREVLRQGVISRRDVSDTAGTIGNRQCVNGAAQAEKAHLHAGCIDEHMYLDGAAVRHRAEGFDLMCGHTHFGSADTAPHTPHARQRLASRLGRG